MSDTDVQRTIGAHDARIVSLETRLALMDTRIDTRLGSIESMLRSLQTAKDYSDGTTFERKRIWGAVAILVGATAGAAEMVWHVWRWVTGK